MSTSLPSGKRGSACTCGQALTPNELQPRDPWCPSHGAPALADPPADAMAQVSSHRFAGRRVEPDDAIELSAPQHGTYYKVPEDWPQYRIGVRWIVYCSTWGSLREGIHTVTEHDDGTITVTPSLVMPTLGDGLRWHGWLRRGVFEGTMERA